MKRHVPAESVIRKVGYAPEAFSSMKNIHRIATYFLPQYFHMFGNSDPRKITSIDDLIGYLKEAHLHTVKVNETDKEITFDFEMYVDIFCPSEMEVVYFDINFLASMKNRKLRAVYCYLVQWFLEYSMVGFNDFEHHIEWWHQIIDDDNENQENIQYYEDKLRKCDKQNQRAKEFVRYHIQHIKLGDDTAKDHIAYLKRSRYEHKKKLIKILRKTMALAKLADKYQVHYDYGEHRYINIGDLFAFNMINDDDLFDEMFQAMGESGEYDSIKFEMVYFKETKSYNPVAQAIGVMRYIFTMFYNATILLYE